MPFVLPPELWIAVLLELAPLEGDYRARQDALLSCCLVSRAFRSAAEPLLQAWVRLGTNVDLVAAALDTNSAFGRAVRVLEADVTPVETVLKLAKRMPELRELRYSGEEDEEICLDELADAMPDLRHLSLDTCRLLRNSFRIVPVFSFLRSICLFELHVSYNALETLLSPTTTPSLGAARLTHLLDAASDDYALLDYSSLPHLNRLDFVHLNITTELLTIAPLPLNIPVLYDLDLAAPGEEDFAGIFATLDKLTAQHLQLLPRDFGEPDSAHYERYLTRFVRLAAWLAAPSTFLRTLSLSTTHRPSNFAGEVKNTLESVVGACKERGIEVSWQNTSLEAEFRVSHGFWRRVRRLQVVVET
ncbi:hypothetical protein JCM8097_004503 [Rhodosporidiobolus ruineniae]